LESSKAFDTSLRPLSLLFLHFPSSLPNVIISGYAEKEGGQVPLLVMEGHLFLTFCFVYGSIAAAI
jgi:hypothetical protein